jgi:hypothetical protein
MTLEWMKDDMGYFAKQGMRQASVWREGKYWRWAVFVFSAKVSGGRTRNLDDAQDYAAFMFKRTFLRAVQ